MLVWADREQLSFVRHESRRSERMNENDNYVQSFENVSNLFFCCSGLNSSSVDLIRALLLLVAITMEICTVQNCTWGTKLKKRLCPTTSLIHIFASTSEFLVTLCSNMAMTLRSERDYLLLTFGAIFSAISRIAVLKKTTFQTSSRSCLLFRNSGAVSC